MNKNETGTPLLIASLILGASIVAASLLIQSSLDRASLALSQVLAAINEGRPAAPTAQTPPRPGRPDPNKYYSVNVRGSPVRGAKDAKVSIVEFSDFQCPFCSRVNPTLRRVLDAYPDDVNLVFKHLPLRIHQKAPAAHAAAEAAHRQDKFWEMHDLIFANQRDMSPQTYEKYAEQLGLNVDRFRKDVISASVKRKVDGDAAEAARLQVTGTPGFFVNGRFVSGAKPFEAFKEIIDEELKKKKG